MATTEMDFIPDFDSLDKKIQDEEFETEVTADVQAQGGGAGAGGLAEMLGFAEIGSDVGTGSGQAGMAGQLLGGIGKMTLLLGAIVGFLALLEPIQQALGFIMRQFELMVVPLVAALLPLMDLLQDFAVKLIQFFRNPQAFISNMVRGLKQALAPLINSIISGLNTVPGVNISPVTTGQGQPRDTGFRSAGRAGDFNDKQEGPVTQFFAGAGSPLALYLISDDAQTEKQNQTINRQDNILE